MTTVEELPFIDEHSIEVAATVEDTWAAVLPAFGLLDGPVAGAVARVLGCDPRTSSGRGDVVGATIPGFRVTAVDRPSLLVLQGLHRASRYAIVLRVEPTATGARCRLESR